MDKPNFPHAYLFKQVSERTTAIKARKGVCKHWGCNRPVRGKGQKVCSTCHSRLQRMRNKKRYIFDQTRDSARKRGIEFNLTFKQFLEFDAETDYCARRGRNPEDLTIDRIKTTRGYEVGNIRVLTWIENCSHRFGNISAPQEAIAISLCEASGRGEPWQKWLDKAKETLAQVETLQHVGATPPEEIPF